jgi:hypothetical protein
MIMGYRLFLSRERERFLDFDEPDRIRDLLPQKIGHIERIERPDSLGYDLCGSNIQIKVVHGFGHAIE